MKSIWIVDDDASIRFVIKETLIDAGFSVTEFASPVQLIETLDQQQPDAIFSDIRMPQLDGINLLENIHKRLPDLPVVIMTAFSDLESAVDAFSKGAFDYLPKPFDLDNLISLANKAVTKQKEPRHSTNNNELNPIIGQSTVMQALYSLIGRISQTELSVLITGETGTGKELVARALHRHSRRSEGPFVAINTAALPGDLLESELFGHQKGAFTGASEVHHGRFEQARGGTLFLDEIGDMPLSMQTRLLRVLAEGEYYRVGGRKIIKTDVRIIAATNQDISTKVKAGEFRNDLLHRINVVSVTLPALRQRTEDIPLLIKHFMKQIASETGSSEKTFHASALNLLKQWRWPGNVRELQNLCQRLTVMAPGFDLSIADLPPEFHSEPIHPPSAGWELLLDQWYDHHSVQSTTKRLERAVNTLEAHFIKQALKRHDGQRARTALFLGIGRNTLTRKMKQLGIKG